MTPDSEKNDREVFAALRADRPEEFWQNQRAAIMRALPRRVAPSKRADGWKLAPALAALFIAAAWLFRHEKPLPPAPPQADAQMLENLDLLNDMDLLERIPEKELI